MRATYRIAVIRGIPIQVHLSFLVVLPFLAYLFGLRFAAAARAVGVPPGLLHGSPWVWGLGVAVGLFLAVLVHELSHALYAARKGVPVRDITLLMIGGVSHITDRPARNRDEAIMALVGPLTSLVIGAVLWGVSRLIRGMQLFDLRFALFYLGELNLALGLFNLIPAFPMDGGRVLRAALTSRMGLVRATRAAAIAGKVFAAAFALLGIFGLDLLLLIIAAFIWGGAEAESRVVQVKTALSSVRVRDLMRLRTTSIDASASLAEAIAAMLQERRVVLPVREGEQIIGDVRLADVEGVPPTERSAVVVGTRVHRAQAIAPDEPAWNALRRMEAEGLEELNVVEGGHLVGTLTRRDVATGVQLRQFGEGPRPWWGRKAETHA